MAIKHIREALGVSERENVDIGEGSYLAADQLLSAQEQARKVAADRGDVENVDLTPDPVLNVLIPEALQFRRRASTKYGAWLQSAEGKPTAGINPPTPCLPL